MELYIIGKLLPPKTTLRRLKLQYGNLKITYLPVFVYNSANFGAEAMWISLNRNKGLKVMRNKSQAQKAVTRQRLAHEHKFGPAVLSDGVVAIYGLVRKYGTNGRIAGDLSPEHAMRWGYISQKVKVDFMWHDFPDCELNRLMRKMKKHGLECDDLHEANLGFMKLPKTPKYPKGRNVLVCIDFGDISVT